MPRIPAEELRRNAILSLISYAGGLRYPLAAKMLRHAITGNWAFHYFDKDDSVARSVKDTSWYQNLLARALTNGLNSDSKQFNLSGSTDFAGTGDLGYAFGKVSYRISWAEVVPLKWMVTLRISDVYDFEAHPEVARDITDILNKLGFAGQESGFLKSYSWSLVAQDEINVKQK